MRAVHGSIVLSSLLLLAACGGDDGGGTPADAGPADAGGDGFSTLIAASWSMGAGNEGYWCADITLDRDLYIGAYRPIAPLGTHHTVLSVAETPVADNPGYACTAQTDAPKWLFASGVGTQALTLPAGIGVHLPAGTQVHLNLHLFNTGESAITGRSGVEFAEVPAAQIEHEAQVFVPGPFQFVIPPTNQPYSHTGTCTVSHDQTLVAIFPHMHQTGVHFKTEHWRDGQLLETLWDQDYQFDSQEFANLTSVDVKAGDQIRTTCTWQNGTDHEIGFGDSSTQEMCFSILMRYPVLPDEDQFGGFPSCTDEF